MKIFRLALLLSLPCLTLCQDLATLSGTVIDPSGGAVPDAALKLVDLRHATVRQATTSDLGFYVFDSLEPGEYSLEASKEGFTTLKLARLRLRARDRQTLRLRLEIGPITESLDVTDRVDPIATDPSFGVSLDQSYASNLPLPGRSLESLTLMAPGVVSAAGGRGGGGQIHSSGMRSTTNYYTLDGLSLSSGFGGGGMRGGGGFRGGGRFGGPMGGGPGGGGAPTDTISLEALQEIRVQTSTFAPEFGRTPGAQISMTTRSGSNALHGSLFEYFGNSRLNANEWFANRSALPRAPMRMNQFGGTLGGPVRKNRTFFFASYEGLRLLEPETNVASVPDLATRRQAPAALRPYVQAFPEPNGAPLEEGAAQFTAIYSNPSHRDSLSVRADHTFNARHTMFVHYSHAPAESEFRGEEMIASNVVTRRESRSHGLTGSLISILGPSVTNDFRANYTTSRTTTGSRMDTFGGAVPLAESLLFPAGVTSANGEFRLNVAGLSGYSIGDQTRNDQRVLNVVDGVTMIAAAHQFKVGADFRLIAPSMANKFYSQTSMFSGLSGSDGALLSGTATTSMISSSVPLIQPLLLNNSVYYQHSLRTSARTTVTYGIRWDLNPAPRIRSGAKPFALCDSDLGRCAITQQLPLYDTRWTEFAPRLGLATSLSDVPGREVILRLGLGVFHDLGYGSTTAAFSGAPYVASRNLVLPVFPLASADRLAPALPPTMPFGQISAAERKLQSPTVYQWNMTMERSMGRGQAVSLGYAGTHGLRLLRTQTSRAATTSYDMLRMATNGAESDYNSVQVQFRRRLAGSLQTQLSYTYAHSIDTASNDMAMAAGFRSLFDNNRGNSDFDVRHSLSFTGSYRLPAPRAAALRPAFSDWFIDWVVSARSGLPLDVLGISAVPETLEGATTTTTTPLTRGLFAQVRPDYTGLPVWLDDPQAPGKRRLNPAAFVAPADFRQGSLGRNSIQGFPMTQIDLSVRRQVPLREGVSLSIIAQAFNALNHPNFANPSPNEGANMASPNFGVATRTLSEASRGGGISFFRTGGPRSVQLAIRLQF